jgi:hypothetical protein
MSSWANLTLRSWRWRGRLSLYSAHIVNVIRRRRQHSQEPRPFDGLRNTALVPGTRPGPAPGYHLAPVRHKALKQLRVLIIYGHLVRTEHADLRLHDELASPLSSLTSIGFHYLTNVPPSGFPDLKRDIVRLNIAFLGGGSLLRRQRCGPLSIQEQHPIGSNVQAEVLLAVLAVP